MKKAFLISFVLVAFSFICQAQGYSEATINALIDSISSNNAYAQTWADEAIKQNKKCSDAYFICALSAAKEKNYLKAIDNFGKALKCVSKRSVLAKEYLLNSRGYVYSLLGENDNALSDFNAAIKVNKKNPDCYDARAEFYEQTEQYDKAEVDYRTLTSLSDDVKYKSRLAYCLIYQDKYEEALTLLNKSIKYQPCEALLYSTRSYAHLVTNNANSAIDDYLQYVNLSGQYNSDYFLLIASFSPDYTLSQLKTYRQKDQNEYTWRLLSIKLLIQEEKYETALTELESFETIDSVSVFSLYQRSICHEGLYQYDKEIACISKMMSMSAEKDAHLYIKRGKAQRNLAKMDLALADFDEALKIYPYHAQALLERGWTYDMQDNYDAALRNYSASLEIHPDNPWVLIQRSKILRRNGDEAAAVADLNRALKLDTVSNTYAFALVLLGKVDEGIAFMHEIVDANPNDKGNMYDLACLLALAEKTQEAASTLKKAVELGYRNYHHILNDSDLDSIREQVDYKEALSYISKKKTQSLFDQLK